MQTAAPELQPARSSIPPWIILSALTLFAGILRLTTLSRPEIWPDEAATFHRVSSTFAGMLEILRQDGFVPLHYELYWLIARKFSLTPSIMRLVPSLAGTLMVPAIYFLSRQLVSRSASLLASAFVSCSAWMMIYSHDAKMYEHFWLFATLHIACLLRWMRTGGRIPYLAGIACGCVMAGLHASGMVLLAVDLIFFLAHPKTTWRRSLLFSLAIALILAGPIGYYTGFNQFTQRMESRGWNSTGIQWIEQRNEGHSTPSLLADTASAYLFGFNFIQETMRGFPDPRPPAPWIRTTATSVLTALLALAFLGTFPWRRKPPSPSPLPTPLTLFYIVSWIVLPVYVFYCASVVGFSSPIDLLPWWAWTLVASFLGIASLLFKNVREKTWTVILPVALPLLLCVVIYLALRDRTPPGSVWMPRYLGITFPAIAIAIAALFTRLPKFLRYPAIALLLGVNLTQSCARLFLSTEPPISIVARDVWDARDLHGDSRTYVHLRSHFGGPNGSGTISNIVGTYHLRLLSGYPIPPIDFRFYTADRILLIRRFSEPNVVASEIQHTPNLKQFITWSVVDDAPDNETYLAKHLSPAGWKIVSQVDYPVRVFWTWSPMYTYRRTVFHKQNP